MAFLNPTEILKKLKIKKDFIAADFGCGSGGWVLPLAGMLEDGKVYAIDLLEEPLSVLRSKIKTFNVLNVEPVQADVEKNSKLFDNSCDLVLMTNLLFQVSDMNKVLEEAKRVLKEKGRILIVDWQHGSVLGPENKISASKVKEVAEKTGFNLEKEFKAGIYHWALIFVKSR
jgi:ubiquinone/menaquinone biosynthesis C-methylase UbiE